jgi:hypothetical protein
MRDAFPGHFAGGAAPPPDLPRRPRDWSRLPGPGKLPEKRWPVMGQEPEKTVFGMPAVVNGLPRRRAVFQTPEALVNPS